MLPDRTVTTRYRPVTGPSAYSSRRATDVATAVPSATLVAPRTARRNPSFTSVALACYRSPLLVGAVALGAGEHEADISRLARVRDLVVVRARQRDRHPQV